MTEARKPRVFITQEDTRKNFLPAREFGELEVVLPEGSQVFRNSVPTVAEVRRKMADFSDEDYILPVGDPVSIGVACATAAMVNEGRFKVLKFDRQMYRDRGVPVYYSVEVDMLKMAGAD